MSVMRCVHGNQDECEMCHEAKVVSIVSPRHAPSRPDNERAKECDWNDGTGDGGVCMALVDGEYVECADACACVSFRDKREQSDSERIAELEADVARLRAALGKYRGQIDNEGCGETATDALASTQATP